MKDKAMKYLEEMEKQAAHFNEQLLMTRGAIQILQVLLAESEEEDHGIPNNETAQVIG